MSRSYKHTPVYKGDKDRFAKKLENRKIKKKKKTGKALLHNLYRDFHPLTFGFQGDQSFLHTHHNTFYQKIPS